MIQNTLNLKVLVVIADDVVRDKVTEMTKEKVTNVQFEANISKTEAILNREGYRFGAVILDAGLPCADETKNWLSTFRTRFSWVLLKVYSHNRQFIKTKKNSMSEYSIQEFTETNNTIDIKPEEIEDEEVLSEYVSNIATNQDKRDPDSSPPPYQAGDTRFLQEAGPLLFSISRTEIPWKLEGDIFTLPVSSTGDLGHVGKGWISEQSSAQEQLFSLISTQTQKSQIDPGHPILLDSYDYEIPFQPSKIILSTSDDPEGGPSLPNAVDACINSIQLATTVEGIETLILPIIGGGIAEQDVVAIIRGILDEFDSKMALGNLKHVILTVYEEAHLEAVLAMPQTEIVRSQRLENDLPAGEDRLNIQSEVKALADAIALKDVKPPLVLGVFGGWGAGKSFVLHLLQERLRQIRCWNIVEDDVREDFPYVGHPYIVHFDAWTFAKADLWASLMQKILFDLDQQLSLEKTITSANKKLLLQGVDIWSLLDGLARNQLEGLDDKISQEVISTFDKWRKEDGGTEALWEAIQNKRSEELKKLEASRAELRKVKKEYEEFSKEKELELENSETILKQGLRKDLSEKQCDFEARLSKKNAQLESTMSSVQADIKKEMLIRNRNIAWTPVKNQMRTFLGKALDDALANTDGAIDAAPVSIWDIAKEMSILTKYIKGFSLPNLVFLALILFFLMGGWLLKDVPDFDFIGTVGSILGVIGSAVGALYTAVSKANRWIEKQEEEYRMQIDKANENSMEKRKELIDKKTEKEIIPIENEINALKSTHETSTTNYIEKKQKEINKERERKLGSIKKFKSEKESEIRTLQLKVDDHIRRAGITAVTKTLRDFIQERIKSRFYDEKLGLLHQVQEDLKEVSEALMSQSIKEDTTDTNSNFFPRGTPRVILIIDDLDRCPPSKVVKVLEATQLLVKTELFVVVLAMDVRYITRSLEKYYRRVLERDGKPSGLDYIEKIVQIPYRVPEITPTAMHSFLQHQMTMITSKATEKPTSENEMIDSEKVEEVNQKPAFTSSLTAEEAISEKLLPTQVQYFNEKELSFLKKCCNAVSVNPRTARRLVNVFKLLKIIWFHRGQHREPSETVKEAMLFLLALSARYPVAMREALQKINDKLRDEKKQMHNLKIILKEHLGDSDLLPSEEVLNEIGLENMQLVKSFSFVGEAEDGGKGPENVNKCSSDLRNNAI